MRRFIVSVMLVLLLVWNLAVPAAVRADNRPKTATPIKYLVVIFDENQSFDHYFGTYPTALNPQDEPPFTAAANTPEVNGLNGTLLTRNPNSAPPFRLDRSMNVTCDNDNHYTDEQKAYHGGLLDQFVQVTSNN